MYYLHFIYQDLATKQTQDFEKYFPLGVITTKYFCLARLKSSR